MGFSPVTMKEIRLSGDSNGNFRMKNSILVHEVIDQTLPFIFTTFYYYFKVNQRNLCYKNLGNMKSKLSKTNLYSVIGEIFQHLLVRILLSLSVQTKSLN